MASTWSSLKIQLMGAGDESGTWGTVTNANLGTVIEEAITGSANVSFTSADVTLTLTDSTASQTARNLRLNLTGTSGGARNLIVPAIEKVYIVNNGLADAVTVKNSTGSGIAVPAGKTMYVFNNGTDVVDAITHLTSLTLGTPLAVAQGGTGSTTATFSGENITSLNASNISSGVVAVAQGGTGSATANFSGANITSLNASNISTGTIANARTTASSSNGASTIVTRDASGNFSANTITANLTGTATSLSTASGSAPSYSARAWVNFNGTGTISIRASANVSSITDNDTGDYTINFTTAMSDANYSAVGSAGNTTTNYGTGSEVGIHKPTTFATGSYRFQQGTSGNSAGAGAKLDTDNVTVAIFR